MHQSCIKVTRWNLKVISLHIPLQGQNNSGAHRSSNYSHQSRKPPEMEGKCMICGKPDHQLGQKCPAKSAKCKDCHKIGCFHKICQSKKMARQRANLIQTPPQDDDDTHIDKNGG